MILPGLVLWMADASVNRRERTVLGDIKNVRLLYLKGALFLLAGLLAAFLILLEHPSLRVAALLMLTIWCFCRAYYFAFYVVTSYADPGYRFAGLTSFIAYLWKRRGGRGQA